MKTAILNHNGEKIREIELPNFFTAPIRDDIVSKVLEARKKKQPYEPSPVAGKQHSARGKVIHRRHVWRSGYGRGMSRVPRKIMSSRKGNKYTWEAAEIPSARGGMRAHPPKVLSMIGLPKINKKEMKIAFISALSSTANVNEIKKKYTSLANEKIEHQLPIIVSELKFSKTKELISSLKKILGDQLFDVAIPKNKIRSGKGKFRGRKYRKNAGLLIVLGKDEKLNLNGFDAKNANELSIIDLAKGQAGRLTIYTEKAISELAERLTSSSKSQTKELEEKIK